MVIAGLKSLSSSQRPAIRAYREHAQKENFTSEEIGFFLAPLLNSAGRMEDASIAVDFLASSNIYDARVRLQRLVELNEARKRTESEITKVALASVEESAAVVVVSGKAWHEGVVGIVASRVARACRKPTIVLSDNGEGMLKGSGRSYGTCDLFAVVDKTRPLLKKFGGHFAAVGLSLHESALLSFKEALQQHYTEGEYSVEESDPDIIGVLHFEAISFELTEMMKRFEPYGQGNPLPKFVSHSVRIVQASPMGKEGNHLRFLFEQEGITHQGVQFKTEALFAPGTLVDIVYTVNENHFRGNTTLQLMIEEVRT